MSNLLDKLFKDKLSDHVRVPAADSWRKVEAGLSKKNKTLVRFRAAAAVSLLGLITWTIVRLSWSTVNDNAAQISKVIEQKKSIPERTQVTQKKKEKHKQSQPRVAQRKLKIISSPPPVVPSADTSTTIHPPLHPETVAMEQRPVAAPAVAEKPEKTFVLEYKLETYEVKPVPAEKKLVAEAKDKDKKKLRKVLDFAGMQKIVMARYRDCVRQRMNSLLLISEKTNRKLLNKIV